MVLPLKALLLAAGKGTRLRPYTYHAPKCLVEIGGEPLLGRWLKNLERIGCQRTLINTHYLSEKVEEYLLALKLDKMELETIYEKELLGTAGTLLANKKFFDGATGLLIHSDNYTNTDLSLLIEAHHQRPSNCELTMLTFNTKTPESCGIVLTDSKGVVQQFYEKESDPPGRTANGAIYVFDQPFLDNLCLQNQRVKDFSRDVLPQMVGHIFTFHTNKEYLDIGTPETLREAQEHCKKSFYN